MVEVRNGLSASLAGLVVLLAVLEATPGIGLAGWATGLACGVVLCVAAARSASNGGVESFGPADLVTLTRATLSCGVAALVADSFVRPAAVGTLVAIATVALVLDAVDGRVARVTGTVSAFGARLDGEADAFLMLVLSRVRRSLGRRRGVGDRGAGDRGWCGTCSRWRGGCCPGCARSCLPATGARS